MFCHYHDVDAFSRNERSEILPALCSDTDSQFEQAPLLPDGGNQPSKNAIDTDESPPDEEVTWRTNASRVGRLFTTSGELYVTERNLIFSPYPTGFGTVQNIGIPVEGIRTVDIIEPWDGGILEILFQGGFRSRLRIELKNEEEEVFILSDIDATIEQISDVLQP